MTLEARTSRLIGKIYEGVFDPSCWDSALREFLDLTQGRLVFLGIIDSAMKDLPATRMVGPETSGLDDAMRIHREDMVPIDPGLPYALARPEGGNFRFCDTSDELTPEPEEWRSFIRHTFGSGDYHSRFTAAHEGVSMVLALHTNRSATRMSAEQERLHALVFEHFERAARLAYRPPDLHVARHAALVVDGGARMLNANDLAEALLSDSDGLSVRNGRIVAADRCADQRLKQAIRRVCSARTSGTGAQAISVPRPSGKRALLLRLATLPLDYPCIERGVHRCTIEIVDEEGLHPVDPALLRALFDLTPREAEVASLFSASVNDLPSAADRLQIGYETARAHLHTVLAKCGVANQVELSRLLARLH